MQRVVAAGALAALAGLAPAGVAAGQQEPVDEQLKRMQAEIEAMRAANQAMRREIDDLRAQGGQDWLTEARASEIRALVSDVLADADVRASLLQDGMTAGWSDHFFVASPDGRFKLQVDGQIQTRYVWSYRDFLPDKHLQGWENGHIRLTTRGHVFSKDIEYLVRWGVTRDDPGLVDGIAILQDAWVRFNLNNDLALTVGQFKIPFTRESLVPSSRQLAVERSLVNHNLELGRSQGLELMLRGADANLRLATIDAAFNRIAAPSLPIGPLTNPQNAQVIPPAGQAGSRDEASAFAVALRFEKLFAGTWDQFEDFTSPGEDPFGLMVGLAGFYQHPKYSGAPSFNERNEEPWFAVTADVSVEWGGASAFGAFTWHYMDDPIVFFGATNTFGVVAQAGFYLAPKVEAFARFEYASVNFAGEGFNVDDLIVGSAGFNYYLDGHDLKWTTDLSVAFDPTHPQWTGDTSGTTDIHGFRPSDEETQVVFRTQFQLLF